MADLQCPATIILARTGATENDHEDGRSSKPRRLSAEGEEQAKELANSLHSRRISGIWASSMLRAQQTADIVSPLLGLPVHSDDRLREKIQGESDQQILDRLTGSVRDIADLGRGETALLIAHGPIITLGLSAHCRNLPLRFVFEHPLTNGGFAEIEVDSDGWHCVHWQGIAR